MKDFNKIVKNLGNISGKLFFKEDIYELIDPEKKPEYTSLLNKTIYKLKAQGIILGIKAGVYLVPTQDDMKLNKIDLLDKYYLKLLKKIITKEVGSHYYISGQKSLEIHMKNYEIADRIFVVNRNINKRVKIGDKEIVFKTISGNVNTGKVKKINLYSKFATTVVTKNIEDVDIKISSLELSLLEAALITDSEVGFDIGLISKALKKYSSVLNKGHFYEIGKYKYIMSFNRLKELSKDLDDDLYKLFLDIIKVNGGLFIGETLRGI
ncbi:hypothetical protein LR004_02800 [Candidatus Gracilibacteria bacterium]|nr:hypothetical protein [Candidatus Gracilibacteria bacterium]